MSGMQHMKYIRDTYHVPAKRGMMVCWDGYMGKITSADGALRVKLICRSKFGNRHLRLHPTSDVAYFVDSEWVYFDASQRTKTACKIYSESLEY